MFAHWGANWGQKNGHTTHVADAAACRINPPSFGRCKGGDRGPINVSISRGGDNGGHLCGRWDCCGQLVWGFGPPTWWPRRELLCCVHRISKTDLRVSHSQRFFKSSQLISNINNIKFVFKPMYTLGILILKILFQYFRILNIKE